jgi:hypothetical protein
MKGAAALGRRKPEPDLASCDLFDRILIEARELGVHASRPRGRGGRGARKLNLLAMEEMVEIARRPSAADRTESRGAGCCLSRRYCECTVQWHCLILTHARPVKPLQR